MLLNDYKLSELAREVLQNLEESDEFPPTVQVHRDFLEGLSTRYLKVYGRCVQKKLITKPKKH